MANHIETRVAALEHALQDASAFCHLKRSGFCWPWCRARVLCDCTGLVLLSEVELPSEFISTLTRTERARPA